MDNLIGRTIISAGASFTGKISNARAVEVNGIVKADIDAEKITIGKNGSFEGKIKAGLVVVSGTYDGTMDAGSVWATASARISGKIQYQTLQMDRGAALNCRVVHNWQADEIVQDAGSEQDDDGSTLSDGDSDLADTSTNDQVKE
ncbi:MAG: polymer-forming cytoskeletal protein [Candidatus Puniceispirillum sp.]